MDLERGDPPKSQKHLDALLNTQIPGPKPRCTKSEFLEVTPGIYISFFFF